MLKPLRPLPAHWILMKSNIVKTLLLISMYTLSYGSQKSATVQNRLGDSLSNLVHELDVNAHVGQEVRIQETKRRILNLVNYAETLQSPGQMHQGLERLRVHIGRISACITFKSGYSSRQYKEQIDKLLVTTLNDAGYIAKKKHHRITLQSVLDDLNEKLALRIQLEKNIRYDVAPISIVKQLHKDMQTLLEYDAKFPKTMDAHALEMKYNLLYTFCQSIPTGLRLPDGMNSDFYKGMLMSKIAQEKKGYQLTIHGKNHNIKICRIY